MPWTFAHPAAVLPLRKLSGPGQLSFAALVTGSMAPDFGYYVGQFALANFAHTPLGLLVICLPSGLLVLLIAVWLRQPVADLLPSPHRQVLMAERPRGKPFTARSLGLIALSLLLGAATHLAWDAFTHEGRFFVQQIEALRRPLFTALGRDFRVFNVLQHVSTCLGLGCMALAYHRHATRWSVPDASSGAQDRRRRLVLVAMAAAALACAAPFALNGAMDANTGLAVSKLVVQEAIYATSVFFTMLIGLALWPRIRDRFR